MESGIKSSQRVSKSCTECGRRKIKCDKRIPCQPCIKRNAAHECRRPIARVRGQLTVYAEANADSEATDEKLQLEELLRQRGALHAQIAELETALALSKPCVHSRTSASTDNSQSSTSFEDLVPAFEQFDVGLRIGSARQAVSEKDIADRLYEPATDPVFLLLPKQDTSLRLVTFSLQTLGWLHCAVDSDQFLTEHNAFWEDARFDIAPIRERRPWLALYLAVLSVGILYLDPQDCPDIMDLPSLCVPLDPTIDIAVHASRIWYETALKEIERTTTPALPVVQALSVLTLCHSNFGEHTREFLLTAYAASMARCLDMHKLGSEAAVSAEIRERVEWSSAAQREVGRRLWWSCVIRDWLGSWARPPSISPASFCCQFSVQNRFGNNIIPSDRSASDDSPLEKSSSTTPSPAHYHSIMSRLAYIFYVYIKANTHQTPPKLLKAIEEIQIVRRNLPLHLSQHFPANDDDREWEQKHEWVPFQRYLLAVVLDFLELGIARVLVSRETEDDPERSRKLAVACANRILHSYSLNVPRPYRLVWTVSAAVVAAAVYISLDMLANAHDYRDSVKAEKIELLSHAAAELKRHSKVAIHAAKGFTMIEHLLSLIRQDPPAVRRTPCTVHDLVKELSASHQDVSSESLESSSPDPVAAYMSLVENESNFGHQQASFGDMFEGRMNEWDTFMLGV